eukprot:CAMPEP_0197849896 /NCGR_PEP_ID=MMETSP1438-20131217/13606_1 /TAXON_ID=1461541 /ORGANISM="Pterosperma sp., Strain CCMP1384" /LENGTH=306 /DNA_ID=CAMNT_0043462791 /DNA_START=118 /DNA_END=1038 /DNA_ORIENTATION=+
MAEVECGKGVKLVPAIHVFQETKDTKEAKILIDELRAEIRAHTEDQELADFFKSPHLSTPPGDPNGLLTDSCLWRFLVANGKKVKVARKQVKEMMLWRKKRTPHTIRATEIEHQAVTGKVAIRGLDKYKRPVVVLDNSKENTKDLDGQMRFLAWSLERSQRCMMDGVEKQVVFIHLAEFSMMNTPPMAATKETIHMLQTCFAETLGHAVLYQCGYVFKMFFEGLKMLIDPKTASKIITITGDVSANSPNDSLMRNLIGDNWKELTGAEQKKLKKNISPGYNHEEHWKKVVEEEEAYFKQVAAHQQN